jgi:hypothetical protein
MLSSPLGRARLVAAVGSVVLALFVCSVVIEVAPDSVAATQARLVTRPFMHPWFAQKWTLFAPDIPRANFTTYLQVRYTATREGAPRTGPLLDVSDTLNASVKQARWAPHRVRRIVTVLEIQAANYAQYRATLDSAQARHPDKPLPAALTRDITGREKALEKGYRRWLSSLAVGTVPPGARVTEVRVVVSTSGVPRLGRGNDANNPPTQTAVAYDSGWLPAVQGVTSL